MKKPNQVFVVDTNVLVDYPDIIPNGHHIQLENPTVDTSQAHIVIPTAVIRELSNFKKESSDRGVAARKVLRRLRELTENSETPLNLDDSYDLKSPIVLSHSRATISIMPITQQLYDFPFQPSEHDMDGQIILTALVAKNKLPTNSNVVLLTNDNGLAIRAFPRGVKTRRYGYTRPEPYTGRRNLKVPFDLFSRWMAGRELSHDEWREFMPEEAPLVANEFIVMDPGSDWQERYTGFANIGRYDLGQDSIVPLKYIRKFPESLLNEGQAIYAEALHHPEIDAIIVTGPAGTGKTYMAAISALDACRKGDYLGVAVVPCHVEEAQIGFLPGDIDEKLDPNVQPIKNALRNHLLKQEVPGKDHGDKKTSVLKTIDKQVELTWSNWFDVIPIAFARGRDFSHQIVIYDEFQDQTPRQADTLIKRQGEASKIIITGDIEQIHAAYLDQHNNGLVYASHQYMGHPRVAQVTINADEVVRHTIVRDIAKRQQDGLDFSAPDTPSE